MPCNFMPAHSLALMLVRKQKEKGKRKRNSFLNVLHMHWTYYCCLSLCCPIRKREKILPLIILAFFAGFSSTASRSIS